MNEGINEVAIAVSGDEAMLAYLSWNESRDVTVVAQRISLEGAALGPALALRTYNVCCGQLAAGDFYGRLSIAADANRYMLCWGEAFLIGCAAVLVGSGDVSTSNIEPPQTNGLMVLPRVVHGASGWRVFYDALDDGLSVALNDDSTPNGEPVVVPALLAAATDSGFAAISQQDKLLYRLGPDLKPDLPLPIAVAASSVTALGDTLSIVGSGTELRIDPSNAIVETPLFDSALNYRMAVAPMKDSVGVLWADYPDGILRFRAVDAAGQAGPVKSVGCDSSRMLPALAATDGAFLVAWLDPKGSSEGFYTRLHKTIRVTRVKVP